LTGPVRHSTPMTRLRKVAMTCGPASVRIWEASSAKVGVADVVQRLDRPVPAQQAGEPAGLACMNGRLVMA
jgi:hypothetical protein